MKCKNCEHEIKVHHGVLFHYLKDALKLSFKCYHCDCINPERKHRRIDNNAEDMS